MSQITEKCPFSQCWRIIQNFPGQLPKFIQFFLIRARILLRLWRCINNVLTYLFVYRYISCNIFMKIQSVVSFHEVANGQTDRQTDRQTNKLRFLESLYCLSPFVCPLCMRWPKNGPFLYSLTLPNINRFSKLFHCQNQEKICNNSCSFKNTWHFTRYIYII